MVSDILRSCGRRAEIGAWTRAEYDRRTKEFEERTAEREAIDRAAAEAARKSA